MKLKLAFAAVTLAVAAIPASAQFHRLESAVMLKSAQPDWDYVTLDAPRGRLFIGRRGEGVVVYDIKSKKAIRTIDPVTKQLAFTLGDAKKIVFVDAKTAKVVGELAMESKKLDGTVPDEEGNLLMALRDKDSVVKIDVANRKVVAEWKTAPCEQPTGIAYDKANKRIFVGCRGKSPVLAVLDAASGKVVTTQPIGRGNDGVVYDAGKIYTSNGVDANLVIYNQVDADTYKLAEATTTRPYARTMAFDPKTKKIYMVTAEGTADPAKKINTGVAPFYPNRYFPDTFTVLTYAPK